MIYFILKIGADLNIAQTQDTLTEAIKTGIQTIETSPQITETKISLITMIAKGGPIMYPLALLLLIKEMINTGNLSNAISMCKNINTPESTMLEQGISRIGQPITEIRTAMDKSGANEISKLEKNLNVLNIIGRIAPMFGFIGTIIGVITIFYDISLAKTVEIEVISKGLYQKMVTSAGGLVVGVIAFVCYHWLNSRIDKLANRMEDIQIKFLDILNEPIK